MTEKKSKNNLYPVFLKLEELDLLLVGGGNVAVEKLTSLLSNSPEAKITVIAPVVKADVRELIKVHASCHLIEREFREADLDKRDLIILATDDKELNCKIKGLARGKRILVNVADTPDLCDFYLGSIVQKGNLKIAVSTNGRSPTAAKRIKELLQDTLPEELDELLANLHLIRNKLKGDFTQKVKRLNEITKILAEKD